MPYAITGASGQLGRLAVQQMLDAGIAAGDIVAVVRDPDKVADLAERGVTVRQGDYGDPASLRAALEGVERLLLISVSGRGASAAHHNVIEAAKATGVQHIAYTSILHADTSSNPLAPEHAATERLLAVSGIPAVILRNAWYYEFYTRLFPTYFDSGEVVGSTGQGRVSGAARVDFAAAAVAVLTSSENGSRTYELGGDSFTLAELARAITTVSGRPITHRDVSDAEYTAELVADGADPGTAGFVVGADASIRAGEMETDSRELEQLVGRPLRPLIDSLQRAI